MVGPGKRELTGIVLNYFYAIGEAAVGLAAWLSRDWVILQFIVSAPPIIFIFYYWLIPESVRWLLARKEHRKAELIILKAAKTNGVIISESILQTLDIQHSDIVDEATMIWYLFNFNFLIVIVVYFVGEFSEQSCCYGKTDSVTCSQEFSIVQSFSN